MSRGQSVSPAFAERQTNPGHMAATRADRDEAEKSTLPIGPRNSPCRRNARKHARPRPCWLSRRAALSLGGDIVVEWPAFAHHFRNRLVVRLHCSTVDGVNPRSPRIQVTYRSSWCWCRSGTAGARHQPRNRSHGRRISMARRAAVAASRSLCRSCAIGSNSFIHADAAVGSRAKTSRDPQELIALDC
jgi:hypothetical protein